MSEYKVTERERDAFVGYVQKRALNTSGMASKERALFALLTVPRDIQKLMTTEQLEAVLSSMASAIDVAVQDALATERAKQK